MKTVKKIGLGISFIILILLYSSVYTVQQSQAGLVLQLGKPIRSTTAASPLVTGPGLHFKWPLITSVKVFDLRLQTLDLKAAPLLTNDQQTALADFYLHWQITNIPLYYERTGGDALTATAALTQQLTSDLRQLGSRYSMSDLMTAKRLAIVAYLAKNLATLAHSFGISITDLRLQELALSAPARAAVLTQMQTARAQIAAANRTEGKTKAAAIRANADAAATILLANTKLQAAEIRGAGDAQAAKIYLGAAGQDPAFYEFYRSLAAYKKIFAKDQFNLLVLKPDSKFFKYFNNDGGLAGMKK